MEIRRKNRFVIFIVIMIIIVSGLLFGITYSHNVKAESYDVQASKKPDIFDDSNINNIKYLYNFDGAADYIYVKFNDSGYAVLANNSYEMLEYSPNNSVDFRDDRIYYGGPSQFYLKNEDYYLNLISGEKITFKQDILENISQYNRQLFSINRNNNDLLDDDNILYNICENNIILNNDSPTVPPFDENNLVSPTNGAIYIDHYEYFLADPEYGSNNGESCTTVATQLMLSYNNYYNDRRIIPDEYLCGDQIYYPEQNPNYCTDPMLMNSYTLGSNQAYHDYLYDNGLSGYPKDAQHVLRIVLEARNKELAGKIDYNIKCMDSHPDAIDSTEILDELRDNRPVVLSTTYLLNGTGINNRKLNHSVLAYGYQTFAPYSNGNSYLGYIVHFGWTSKENQVWANSAWFYTYMSLKINHEHSYEDTGIPVNNQYRELKCKECGHRTVDSLYTTSEDGESITGAKYILPDVIVIPDKINDIAIKSINDEAFYNNENIIDVSFQTVELVNIGFAAFKQCSNLRSINIPNDVEEIKNSTFEGCINLSMVVLPITLTKISSFAFYSTGIASINIPNGVTEIGSSAFGYCYNLQHIFIPNSVTYVDSCAFIGCLNLESVELSNNITCINDGVFMGCVKLTSIDIHEGITYIGEQALSSCGLESVSLPYSMKIIDSGAFKNCENLQSVSFFYGVETIGEEAFSGCTALKSIKIPFTVNTIGEGAFKNCSALTDVELTDGITAISDYMFYGCIKLKTIIMSEKVRQIGAYSFNGCGLTSFVVLENISFIGENAFENSAIEDLSVSPNNDNFSTQNRILYDFNKTEIVYVPNKINIGVVIPKTMKCISSHAFVNRDELLSITIPQNVMSIGASAFSGCNKLTCYVEKYETKPIGWHATWNSSNRPVIWRCSLDNAGSIASMRKTPNNIENVDAIGGINAPYRDGFSFEGWSFTINKAPSFTAQSVAKADWLDIELYAVWTDLIIADFKLNLINSGTAYEIGVKNGKTLSGDIMIPAYYCDLPVIKIADYGFCDNYRDNANARTNEIISFTIPDTINEIGKCAFAHCVSMTAIYFSDESLLSIIGEQAFSDCCNLQSIVIPRNTESIEQLCFCGCFELNSVEFAENCKLETIGNNAFDSCEKLASISIPDNVNYLGLYVFDACRELREVKLPNGITVLSNGLFSGCHALEEIIIPNSVTSIGENAFNHCALKEIIIPSSVSMIGDYAFQYNSPNKITVSNDNEFYKSVNNCLIQIDGNILICGSNNSLIPNTILIIEDYAFSGCSELVSISIPDSVKEIGCSAFEFCKNLQTVIISALSLLDKIGDNAFAYTAITSMKIPLKTAYIGSGAFSGCKKLTNVYFANSAGWWYCNYASETSGTAFSPSDINDSAIAATYLAVTYSYKIWKR